jgi:hypothetical protein
MNSLAANGLNVTRTSYKGDGSTSVENYNLALNIPGKLLHINVESNYLYDQVKANEMDGHLA